MSEEFRKFLQKAKGEFQEKYTISSEEMRDQQKALTGGIPEVADFINKFNAEEGLAAAATIMQMEDIGITGKSILTLLSLVGNSRSKFGDLVAAVWNSHREGSTITSEQLILGLENAEHGLPHGLNIDEAIERFKSGK
jgi:hypothetical protein